MRFTKPETKLQIEQHLISAIEMLDVDRVHSLLKKHRGYLKPMMAGFIKNLCQEIQKFKSKGETFLDSDQGHCIGECNRNTPGYRFSGPQTGHYFDVIFFDSECAQVPAMACINFKVLNEKNWDKMKSCTFFNFKFRDGDLPG